MSYDMISPTIMVCATNKMGGAQKAGSDPQNKCS